MGKTKLHYVLGKEEESSYATSVINELVNEKFDVKAQTSIIDLQTNSDFQLFQTSYPHQKKIKHLFMECNSGQDFIVNSEKRETDVQAKQINPPVSIIGYDLPLDLSIHNSHILVENCGTNDIGPQFSTIKVASMSNSENKYRDLNTARMNIDSLMLNKTGLEFSSKKHQQRSNVKMGQLLSKNCLAYSEDTKLNNDFESMKTVHNNETPSKSTRLSQMSHKFLVSRHIAHDSIQEYDLDSMSHPVPAKEYKPNQQLKSSNKSSVKVTRDSTFTTENELTFSNQICSGFQNQISDTEVLDPHTTESIQPCSADATAAVIGPSCSLESERTCSICRKEFSSKWTLKRHYKIHSGERSFTCNICQQNFTQKGHIDQHIQEVHMGEKSHKCEICGNTFSRKYSLKIHIRIHTGEKPYKCDICKRAFSRKHILIDHVKRRHKLPLPEEL